MLRRGCSSRGPKAEADESPVAGASAEGIRGRRWVTVLRPTAFPRGLGSHGHWPLLSLSMPASTFSWCASSSGLPGSRVAGFKIADADPSRVLATPTPMRVVRRLHYRTSYYGRCWEISSAHLDAAHRFAELADIATPTLFLFVAFRIPYSPAVGLEADRHALDRREPARGRRHHGQAADAGAPREGHAESLVYALRLAALADVRMLVFDADAQVLERTADRTTKYALLRAPRGVLHFVEKPVAAWCRIPRDARACA